MKKILKLLIVDDHQIVIDGIKSLLADEDDILVVGEANNGKQALEVLNNNNADIVLMDIDMPVLNGYDTTRILKNTYPKTKVIALTMHNEKAFINNMIDAGAWGYVLKNISKEDLLKAIHEVSIGNRFFGSDISLILLKKNLTPENKLIEHSQTDYHNILSGREIELIKYIAQGFSNKEIAKYLSISPRTVDTHRANILKKLDIKNIAGIIKFAYQHNLID